MDKETKRLRKGIKSNLKNRDFDNALQICQEYLKLADPVPDILTFQGVCHFHLQDVGSSIKCYERALDLDGSYLDALKGLGQCYINSEAGEIASEKRLSVFEKLIKLDVDGKNAPLWIKESIKSLKCMWETHDYMKCFERMVFVSTDQLSEELLPFMIKDIYQKNNLRRFVELVSHFPQLMMPNQELISIEEQTKFLFVYGLQSNFCGENPTIIIESLISCRNSYYRPVKSDTSNSSVGSDDTGVLITPTSTVWWPAQILRAQLWTFWEHLEHWNGSPTLNISEETLDDLQVTKAILRKDFCLSKHVVNVIEYIDIRKFDEASSICLENINLPECAKCSQSCQFKGNMCVNHCSTDMVFLDCVACASSRNHIQRMYKNLRVLIDIILEKPTYHNKLLLKPVLKLFCYSVFVFNTPMDRKTLQLLHMDDLIFTAWSALWKEDFDILTLEVAHPMIEAVQQYLLGTSSKRHVNIEKLLSIRRQHPNNLLYNFILVKVLNVQIERDNYGINDYENILEECHCFEPRNPTYLLYIGDMQRIVHRDDVEAAKYYQKSVKFRPDPEKLKLFDLLSMGNESVRLSAKKSYERVLEVTKDPKLYIRLALLYEDDPKISMDYLQKALHVTKEDPLIYELLAERYLKLGKFSSAFKASSKALELEPTLFRQYNFAEILLKQGYLSEALSGFESILETTSTYSLAMLGAVKVYSQLSLKMANCGRFLAALEMAGECMGRIEKLVLVEPRWSSPWKHLGDTALLLSQIRDCTIDLGPNIRSVLELDKPTFGGSALVQLSIASYNRGLELQPGSTEYLLYLTRSYLVMSHYNPGYLLHASNLVKRAVTLRPRDHTAWNFLGLICMKQKCYKLAQHALVKSIQLYNKTNNKTNNTTNNTTKFPEGWTNLGLLYMLHKEDELANKCLAEAQSNDPKYTECWVAQAYLAGSMGYQQEERKLFKDLIRDVERDTTVEGTLGFGVDFCRSAGALSAELVHDLLTATVKCAQLRGPNSWVVFNVSGYLFEHLELYSQSLECYVTAVTLTEDPETISSISQNVERVKCKSGRYSEMSLDKPSVWLAVSYMRQRQYGMASSVLDNLAPSEDISLFQAALCSLCGDTQLAKAHLTAVTSPDLQLYKRLVVPESRIIPGSAHIPPSLHSHVLHLNLKLQAPLNDLHGNLPPECRYRLAKYLTSHNQNPDIVLQTLDRLLAISWYQEDLYELYIQSLVLMRSEENREVTECRVKSTALKALHMFPWRESSDLLRKVLRNS